MQQIAEKSHQCMDPLICVETMRGRTFSPNFTFLRGKAQANLSTFSFDGMAAQCQVASESEGSLKILDI